MNRITKARTLGVLGPAPKPKAIWQRQFDRDDEALRHLAQCDWDHIRDADLRCYLLDLNYVELQPDLFRHAFPACLNFWYTRLLQDERAEIGDADFHRALLTGRAPWKLMTEEERWRLFRFFIDGILDRIDLERGLQRSRAMSPGWIGALNALGLIAPIIPHIWRAWWSLETPGQAVCAIKYASGLIYLKGENPIYMPWTPQEGGGGPYLAEWDAGIYDSAWLEENLRFLVGELASEYLIERLSVAADRLRGEPEYAVACRVKSDASARKDMVAIRIEDLVSELAQVPTQHRPWD